MSIANSWIFVILYHVSLAKLDLGPPYMLEPSLEQF